MQKKLTKSRATTMRLTDELSMLLRQYGIPAEDVLSASVLLQKYGVGTEADDEILDDRNPFFDASGVNIQKANRRRRRRNTAKAKRRLVETAEIAESNLEERLNRHIQQQKRQNKLNSFSDKELKQMVKMILDDVSIISNSDCKVSACKGSSEVYAANKDLKEILTLLYILPDSPVAVAIRLCKTATKVTSD